MSSDYIKKVRKSRDFLLHEIVSITVYANYLRVVFVVIKLSQKSYSFLKKMLNVSKCD